MTHDQLKLYEAIVQQVIADLNEKAALYTSGGMTEDAGVYRDQVNAIRALLASHAKLEEECARLRNALERIRDMDYRGNRHTSAEIAEVALKAKEQP